MKILTLQNKQLIVMAVRANHVELVQRCVSEVADDIPEMKRESVWRRFIISYI